MENEKRLVVVLTRNYSTGLSVVRSLGFAGYPVDVIASGKKEGKSAVVSKSRFVSNASEVITEKVKDAEDTELLKRLLEYEGKYEKKPVLFPADDYTASVMDYYRDKLKDVFLMPYIENGKEGQLAHLMNKTVQGRIAQKVGFPVAKGWEISLRDENIYIPDDMIYPCFVKPAESITGYKLEMKKCCSKEELENHLNLLRSNFSNREILVQEFLNIDREIELDGLCFDQEIIIPAVSFNSKVAEHEKGVPIAGKLVPFDELGEVKKQVIDVLKEFRYTGMFDMGILDVNGTVYFNEINLRSGGPNYVYYESGVNLPELFVKKITGDEISKAETEIKEYGKTYIYEEVAWNEIFAGLMSEEEYFSLIETSDVRFMYNEDDLKPWEIFWDNIEKTKASRKAREDCIANAAVNAGWTKEEALEKISKTRELLGITYKEYDRCELWKYPQEEQEEAYRDYLEKKEKWRVQKEACIESAIKGASWEYDEALANIDRTRELLGITYREYDRCELWKYPQEEQEKEYRAILEKREKRRLQKEACIESAMKGASWEYDEALANIDRTRELLGITYREYDRCELWKYPISNQEEEYKKILERREKRKKLKEDCILAAMQEAGWEREKAEKEIEAARQRLGITYAEYKDNHFSTLSADKQDKVFKKISKRRKNR